MSSSAPMPPSSCPGIYACLEAERIKYAIRCQPTKFLQKQDRLIAQAPGRATSERFGGATPISATRRPVGPSRVASSPRSSGICARLARRFIVTNMSRPTEQAVAFNNKRLTPKQWTRKARVPPSRRGRRAGRSQPTPRNSSASPYNLGNFPRTLATPEPKGLVADELEGEGDQDCRRGCQPRPLRCLQIAVGAANFPADSATDRRTTGAAAGRTCLRRRCSRVQSATDDRIASRCQRKRPDQTLYPYSVASTITAAVSAANLSCQNQENAQKCTRDRESSGESRLNQNWIPLSKTVNTT